MLVLTLLTGIWTTTCIQTQINFKQSGYVKETYTIEKDGIFEFRRDWYSDSKCFFPMGHESESGILKTGKKVSTIFRPGEVYEADFHTQSGIDLGAVSVQDNTLLVARGVSNSNIRNTMLSLFEFRKK